jgi:uncharacterized membrane protein affecting hemolysin expression
MKPDMTLELTQVVQLTAEATSSGRLNETTAIIFVVLGVLGFILAGIILAFYILVRRKQEARKRNELKVRHKKRSFDVYKF